MAAVMGQQPTGRGRGVVALLAASAVVALASIGATVFVLAQPDTQTAQRASSGVPVSLPELSQADVQELVARYADAYSSEDLAALNRLFAPGFTRTNAGDPPEDRTTALATYAEQFGELENPSYEVTGLLIDTRGGEATARGGYTITSAAGTVGGTVELEVAYVDGEPLVTAVTTAPDAAEEPPAADEEGPPPERGAGHTAAVRIKTWYTTWGESSYVHFKAVDESTGQTVAEASGSDNVDLGEERAALAETSERQALVEELVAQLTADGWEELGPADGGEWYELRFGR